MAQIDVDGLLADYEQQLGQLQGAILKERAAKRAEIAEVQEIVRGLQDALSRVPEHCPSCQEPITIPDAAPPADGPEIGAVGDDGKPKARKAAPRKRAPKKASSKKTD